MSKVPLRVNSCRNLELSAYNTIMYVSLMSNWKERIVPSFKKIRKQGPDQLQIRTVGKAAKEGKYHHCMNEMRKNMWKWGDSRGKMFSDFSQGHELT